ncbi:MAG: hypothetical protein FWH37_02400 [Candidatus Bathyarchaeota archaeon]|nr:hypothetical protein [Candidatus Termiticorpusculum sp.]
MDVKKLVAFVTVVCLFFSFIVIAEKWLSSSTNNSQSSDDYVVLTLALYQTFDYTQNGVRYEFRYVSGGQGNLVQVSLDGQTVSYAAVSGAKYDLFDLTITIYSATDQMLVLHVTST